MPRRREGDSRQKRTFEIHRTHYETRHRIEREEKERRDTLMSERNLLIMQHIDLTIKRINTVYNDVRLNSRYDHFIAVPNFQDIIRFSQESHPQEDIMSRYHEALNNLHDIQSNIAKYADLRNKYINDCQDYNERSGNHNSTAREKNKVESIDIEGDYKLDPFTPSDLDLSKEGLSRAVRDLIAQNRSVSP
jgi:hypothetical protein